VTNTWLKSVWGKVDKFNITEENAPLPIEPPCAGDKWFMQAVIKSGVTCASELIQINKFCWYQQVLLVSDVLAARGRVLDKRYLELRPDNKNWSTLIFPIENPLQRNLKLWKEVLYSLDP
jgi:hypothetical protein